MIQDKMVRARRQYHHHHNHHQHHHNNNNNNNTQSNGTAGGGPRGANRHVLNHHHFHRSNKRPAHVPSAPSNTTQFIMNDHELIEPDFDLMHSAIMEHYNRRKRRKTQIEEELQQQLSDEGSEKSADLEAKNTGSLSVHAKETQQSIQSVENDSPEHKSSPTIAASPLRTATTTTTTPTITKSPLKDVDDEESKNHHHHQKQQQPQQENPQQMQEQKNRMQHTKQTTTTQLQESTNVSQPTTPVYRPAGSPGDEDGLSPFINHEHLQSEFQEIYANIHTERLSSMSKHQLVDKYLLLEERVEELENQLRESQTASAAASHG